MARVDIFSKIKKRVNVTQFQTHVFQNYPITLSIFCINGFLWTMVGLMKKPDR
jgi:hypothetical protein